MAATLRPGQQQMAHWRGGLLAVSAVPGAGKSTGMARAAAIAIARFRLTPRRQLVVVTFTRAAAAALKAKIRTTLGELGLPIQGFTVLTLHGLAFQIASGVAGPSTLPREAALVTPDRSHRLIRTCVDRWMSKHPGLLQILLEGTGFDGEEAERLRRQSVLRTEVLPAIATVVVREAKSSGLTPEDLERLAAGDLAPHAESSTGPEQRLDCGLAVAAGMYREYEALLRETGAIDYDDGIWAALRALADPEVRRWWQARTFAVFEDEAQDSSPLQSRLIETLVVENLIRVGDPNQAINSTFTPADPAFFRAFCEKCHAQGRLAHMDRSGRSSPVIIAAANFLVEWANREIDPAPFLPQAIQPVGSNDPQPKANPAPIAGGVELARPADIHESVAQIGRRSRQLLAGDPSLAVAVLVRTNEQGRFVAKSLGELHGDRLPVLEVGAKERRSHVPGELLSLLQWMARPHSGDRLKAALRVLTERKLIPTQDLDRLAALPEQFLYPGPLDPPLEPEALAARRFCVSLLTAHCHLPHPQLLSFLALALQYDRTELATADKLAGELAQRGRGDRRPTVTLEHLAEIVASESFEPVDAEPSDDSPYTRPGQVTVITMHKAKGLEWDVVFIPFLQETSLPGQLRAPLHMQFLGEFDLAECVRTQVRYCSARLTPPSLPGPGDLPELPRAWQVAGQLKTAEEYRLLYVAMTRAKRLLWLAAERSAPFSWNKPDNLQNLRPTPAFLALEQYRAGRQSRPTA